MKTFLELQEMVLKYNELLAKYLKGDLWFGNKNVTKEQKDKQIERFAQLTKELCNIDEKLNKIIKFESLKMIEIDKNLEREEVELCLKNYEKFEQERLSRK